MSCTPTWRREVPLLFSGSLVLAILAGRKTQTRRLPLKPGAGRGPRPRCRVGDFVYVRETWCATDLWVEGHELDEPTAVRYRTDGTALSWCSDPPVKLDTFAWSDPECWCPSMSMPRWAARIFLEVTATCLEPLHRLGARAARLAGIEQWPESSNGRSPILTFADLWDEIYGTREGMSWRDNPTVEVIEFKVAEVKG